MNILPIAQKKEFQAGNSPYEGKFVIEPLYPGFGLTIGNALRRILLSSLEGVAITFIRLKGAEHEFSTITGVKEDLVEIGLNLKQVRFEVEGEFEEPIKMELVASGEKEIKAGDFKKTAGVKIANPELLIATLTDHKAEFTLEVWLEKGRGYLPTESMNTKEKEVGMIALDAFFSPIKRVAIDTENMRVGDMTNWDRLILSMETDGSITPEEALTKAAQILVEQFSFLLSNKSVKEIKAKSEEEAEEEISTEEAEEKPKKRARKKKEE
ncbi:MAG TPA: DNA-directed RNA polymerase subunit alpha [bacterium]|nr:DNA-directed RNA polymerase subunit alpha [bacterium]